VIARARRTTNASAPAEAFSSRGASDVVRQLEEIERDGGDGTVRFGARRTLHVSSLDKPFFPDDAVTKGDVMRYYASVASALLPVIKDRPLILKRYPNGIRGPSFFQQNAGDHLPAGVRTATVETESGADAERLIGGDLQTLLYTVQIGTIAVHTWQSRIRTPRYADTSTIDLDPGERVPFKSVVELAKRIKAELDELDLVAGVKTSGSSGIHIVLPMPARTSFDFAAAVAQGLAERVTRRNPKLATVERSIKARPRGTIYVDAQQNSAGKSVVAAYSVRERTGATVSAPLEWSELRATLRLDTFTLKTMPARLRKVGDLWGAAMSRRNSKRALDRVLRNASDGR
jgi:bifunctional non-homologous end joining protein LigD